MVWFFFWKKILNFFVSVLYLIYEYFNFMTQHQAYSSYQFTGSSKSSGGFVVFKRNNGTGGEKKTAEKSHIGF